MPPEKPSLAETFNASTQSRKISGNSIEVTSDSFVYRFDFLTRTVFTWEMNVSYRCGTPPTPFSQFDREWLDVVRKKLIDMRRNPPERTREKPLDPPKGGSLNL